jgi:hypothetical protein
MEAMKFSIDIFGMYVELNHFTLHVSGSGGNLALVLIQPPLPLTVSKSLQVTCK